MTDVTENERSFREINYATVVIVLITSSSPPLDPPRPPPDLAFPPLTTCSTDTPRLQTVHLPPVVVGKVKTEQVEGSGGAGVEEGGAH